MFERIAETATDAAELVEPLEAEGLLVRRDLEDRVGGGVADGLAGPHVLLAELFDDRRAGGVAVGENAGKLALLDQRSGQRFRKGGNGFGEIAPVEIDRGSGDLPVAGGRVLAA